MPANRRPSLIEKKVFFYRVFVDGQAISRANEFNFARLLSKLNALPYTEEGRYEADEDDAVVSCFVDGETRMRFGRIRRSNLPPVANGRNVTAIPLAPQAGLFECCHVAYFGNGVIGAEFNHYAPRISARLPGYLVRKAQIDESFEVRGILRGSPIQAFRRLQSVRSVTIKVATSEAQRLADVNGGLIARVAAASRQDGVDVVELTLGTTRGRARTLAQGIVSSLERVLRMPDIRESIDKLSAKGYVRGQDSAVTIDLLEDDLIVSKQFLEQTRQTKTLDRDDAYAKIGEAYTEIRDLL